MSSGGLPPKIGKYVVLSVLGRGGMGVVYRARDPHIDREVAIKTIRVDKEDPDLLARLKTEARSAGRLDHPNIVTVYDFGEENETAYIVMELVEGLNLARVIETQRPMSLGRKLDVIIQVCEGLAYAHELGVIHRDIKPANVCVTSKGVAKILDFGLAYAGAARVTKTGMMSGTVAYMSPERLRGVSGPAGDIFAVGIVCYELLTFRRAYVGDMAEVMTRILSGESPITPSEIGDVPAEIDPVIMKAVAPDPRQRYTSAIAFAQALEAFRDSAAFRDFISDKRRTDELERRIASFVDNPPSSANPYSAPTGGEPSEAPTVRMETTEATALSAVPGVETVPATPIPPPRRRMLAGLSIAAVLLLGAAILLVGRRVAIEPQAETQPQSTTQAQKPPPPPTRSSELELQRELLQSLAKEVSTFELTREQRLKFVEAQTYGRLAEKRLEENDRESGAKLLSSAIQMLREILTAREAAPTPAPKPPAPVETAAALREWQKIQSAVRDMVAAAARNEIELPAAQKRSLDRRLDQLRGKASSASVDLMRAEGDLLLRDYRKALEAAKRPEPAPTPPPPLPAPSPAPEPAPEPQPVRPSVDDLRREISAFIRSVELAYQSKDVDFFRRNSLRFSAEMERAIRSSPSVRVEFDILAVELDNTAARVTVKRTDTFADRDVPPGVQTLIYILRRDSQGWKIVELRRAGQ